jgi:hypothetical protein
MSDHGELDDATVASLVPTWTATGTRARLRASAPDGAPAGALVVQNMTSLADVDDLCVLADGALDAAGTRATDAGGWSAVGDEVAVWDAGDEQVKISRRALVDLLARLVDAALERRDELDEDTVTRLGAAAASLRGSA